MERTDIFSAVHCFVADAASRLRREGYKQENGYLKAFIGRLDGVISFENSAATIDLKCTNVDDDGPGNAEFRTGADFGIIYEAVNCLSAARKGLLGQGKNDSVEELSKSETRRLIKQCEKMERYTDHYLVLEPPYEDGGIPNVRLGNPGAAIPWHGLSIPFDVYFVDHLIACTHGDRRNGFIDGIHHSDLVKLTVKAEGLDYEPDPSSAPRP